MYIIKINVKKISTFFQISCSPNLRHPKVTTWTARKPENVVKTLRVIQFLQQRCNRVIGPQAVPTTISMFVGTSVLCNYAIISIPVLPCRLVSLLVGKFLGAMMSSMATLFVIFACDVTSKVVISYAKVVRAWKNETTSSYYKKLLKSLRPEGIKVASFMTIQKITTVHTVLAIIRYTGRVLIWLKDKGIN